MILLDACTSFCTAVSSTLGPTMTEILLGGLGLLIVWWRNRKHVASVVAPLVARAEKAEVQLAEVRASLRPMMLSTPLPPTSSSSGNWEPVTMPYMPPDAPKARPSMPDPRLSGDAPLPRPGRVPEPEEPTTRPDSPAAKRK